MGAASMKEGRIRPSLEQPQSEQTRHVGASMKEGRIRPSLQIEDRLTGVRFRPQ